MLIFHSRVRAWLAAQKGQGLAEYALILSFIAIMLITALFVLKNDVSAAFSTIGSGVVLPP